jgi:deoxyribonuclease-4
MSIAGGYYKAIEAAALHEMDTVQVFTKNNNQWRAKPISDEEAELFARTLAEKSIQRPIAHASYLINLASPDDALRQKSIDSLIVELTRAAQLGIAYVVVHPGAHTTVSQEEGIALVAASLDEAHRQLPAGAANVALEITAGQGTCLGCSLAQLAAMIDQVEQHDRIGVCLDTCHLFAAGYDIRDRKAYLALWREFDALLGRERLKAIHLNDSKRELGSRVDRHEHIGQGHIGLAGFAHFLRDKRLKDVPMYLETPKGDHNGETWDAINLRTLRDVAAGRQ